jgi:pyruvate/2-oxoglutarate dehydrogenase complex dihydrolipoamide acyltransferase (E2) component
MKVEVLLPQWGMGMSEGTVVRWSKAIGDTVVLDEPLVEVETAKATDFVTAPATGVLSQIVATEGVVVQVGQPLAVIEAAAGDE